MTIHFGLAKTTDWHKSAWTQYYSFYMLVLHIFIVLTWLKNVSHSKGGRFAQFFVHGNCITNLNWYMFVLAYN